MKSSRIHRNCGGGNETSVLSQPAFMPNSDLVQIFVPMLIHKSFLPFYLTPSTAEPQAQPESASNDDQSMLANGGQHTDQQESHQAHRGLLPLQSQAESTLSSDQCSIEQELHQVQANPLFQEEVPNTLPAISPSKVVDEMKLLLGDDNVAVCNDERLLECYEQALRKLGYSSHVTDESLKFDAYISVGRFDAL